MAMTCNTNSPKRTQIGVPAAQFAIQLPAKILRKAEEDCCWTTETHVGDQMKLLTDLAQHWLLKPYREITVMLPKQISLWKKNPSFSTISTPFRKGKLSVSLSLYALQ